ncbi:MAG: hypothetical protein R3268_04760 [Acidiferrobacterales bacterium]|nr:hypothetical protein [Acidiferrobacterales bacterium]
MKTVSQIQAQRIPAQDWNITPRYIDWAMHLYRLGREIAEEVWATIAGVFEMPFRHPMHDKHLDRLDDHLLADIGYERIKSNPSERRAAMYLSRTELTGQRTPIRHRTTQPVMTVTTTTRPATRTPTVETRPEPLIDAWARRALSANGFGEAGC